MWGFFFHCWNTHLQLYRLTYHEFGIIKRYLPFNPSLGSTLLVPYNTDLIIQTQLMFLAFVKQCYNITVIHIQYQLKVLTHLLIQGFFFIFMN